MLLTLHPTYIMCVSHIPAQLLSHFIVQLHILLPEASHGVIGAQPWDSLQWKRKRWKPNRNSECEQVYPTVRITFQFSTYRNIHLLLPGSFPPYLARVNTALVFTGFLADVRLPHTSPTDIISSLDQLSLTTLKGLGLTVHFPMCVCLLNGNVPIVTSLWKITIIIKFPIIANNTRCGIATCVTTRQ